MVKKKKNLLKSEIVPVELHSSNMSLSIEPATAVAQAMDAAAALKGIIKRKPKPLIVGGKQYLEFEDWQTVGWFYGVTVGCSETMEIHREGRLFGFSAKAEALRNGIKVSSAEASCLRDEINWKDKPEFQLKSMAQTRACAKALRNVLSFVAVLGGYAGIPAEEMQGIKRAGIAVPPAKTAVLASQAQRKTIYDLIATLGMDADAAEIVIKKYFKMVSLSALTREQANKVIGNLQVRLKEKLEREKVQREEQSVDPDDIPF